MDNVATNSGGEIFISNDTGGAVLSNCILWGNTDSTGGGEAAQISSLWNSPTELTYCCVENCGSYCNDPNTSNIGADPLFADSTTGDYRLSVGSPCIDAGDNEAVPPDEFDWDQDGDLLEPIPFDLDGNARFVDVPCREDAGNSDPDYPDLGIVDMGAYENPEDQEQDSDGDGIWDCNDTCDGDDGLIGDPCDSQVDADDCESGTFDCSTGTLTCTDDDALDDADGDGIWDCDDTCVGDDALIGLPCDSQVDPDDCESGIFDCSTGTLTCADDAALDDADGDGIWDCDDTCDGDDNLIGQACDSQVDRDDCESGTFECSTGTLTCTDDDALDDVDGDGVWDCNDLCPGTPPGISVGPDGCPLDGACCFPADICIDAVGAEDCTAISGTYLGDGLTCDGDPDDDGAVGCDDGCPLDPEKTEPGVCGCGTPDVDGDGDTVPDCIDLCPDTPPDTPVDDDGCALEGACCFEENPPICLDGIDPDNCATIDGTYQGNGTECAQPCQFPIMGDGDQDGDVDLWDYGIYLDCVTGPGGVLSSGCEMFDFDGDGDIDSIDWSGFQAAFGG